MRAPLLSLVLLMVGCGGRATPPPPPAPAEPAPAEPAGPSAADVEVTAIADALWAEIMRTAPTWASYLGQRDRDDELPDLSPAARAESDRILDALRARARAVDPAALDARHRVIRATLLIHLDDHFAYRAQCGEHAWEVSQLNGPQSWLGELPAFHVVDGEQRARDLITRYAAIPTLFEQHVANLRVGLAVGRTAARINVERVIEQLDRVIATPLDESPFLAPVIGQIATLGEEPYPGFEDELRAAVTDQIMPAYAMLRAFLNDAVLPAARAEPGVATLPAGGKWPAGEVCYRTAITHHTGLERTADEIHELGLAEVARIRGEMKALVEQMGGDDVDAFLTALAARPDQHLDSETALVDYNRALLDRAHKALPRAFGRLPQTPIEVKPIEAFRAPESPAAYYYSAPEDKSRPAYYYLNTHNPETRLLYKMPALAWHEAIPGHHLQNALAAEQEALPTFMREYGSTAFGEGWALYAEGLGFELGLYETPEEKLGALTYEIWRAARLVIDTGLHSRGWTRQQSIDYLAAQTGHDLGEVTNEVDRYIVWPGQALAYKIGQLEFSRLRAEATEALGDRFDLRAFHDHLLSMGSLPLPVLRAEMTRWLAAQQN